MNNSNLLSSRWAPASSASRSSSTSRTSTPLRSLSPNKPPPSTSTPTHHPTLFNAANLPIPLTMPQRTHFTRLTSLRTSTRHLRRLHHKSHLLLSSHAAALQQLNHRIIGTRHFTLAPGEAESMFRVDFFEWYVLLERCLVALLASVGVEVSAGFDPSRTRKGDETADLGGGWEQAGGGGDAVTGSNSIIGDKNVFSGYGHRFHQNVLEALDTTEEQGNSLHAVLGVGKFREYLGLCKAFRNRWKDAEVEDNNGDEAHYGDSEDAMRQDEEMRFERRLKRYQNLLRDLQLDEMLGCMLESLERAKSLVETELRKNGQDVGLPNGSGRPLMGTAQMEMEVDIENEEQEAWNSRDGDEMEWD